MEKNLTPMGDSAPEGHEDSDWEYEYDETETEVRRMDYSRSQLAKSV